MSESTGIVGQTTAQQATADYKFNWSDQWTNFPNAEVLEVQQAIAPASSTASVIIRWGRVKRAGSSSFTTTTPTDWKDCYVRIQYAGQTIFVGYAPAEQIEVMGTSGGVATADYRLACYGLEYLLEFNRVWGSRAYTSTGVEDYIDRTLVFNQRDIRGFSPLGNRSTEKTAPENGSYIFSDQGEVWTARDIAEYLLIQLALVPVDFRLGGQADLLNTWTPPSLNLEGLTIREALDRVIDRRRGAAWRIVPGEAPDAIATVEVFSVLGATLVEGTVSIPANPNVISVNPDANHEVQDMTLVGSTATRYGVIQARGAQVKSILSLELSAGELAPVWTAAEETAYKAAADEERTADRFLHVYRAFIMPATFDFTRGGSSNEREWDRVFLRQLPLVKDWDLSDGHAEYREPFALVKVGQSQGEHYQYVDRLDADGLTAAQVRMLDTAPGVELRASPNHTLALNHFDPADEGTEPTETPPEVDYSSLIVTVAIELDSVLQASTYVPGGDVNKSLIIPVPDAEAWAILKDTVTDIAADGQLEREPADREIRNDMDRLKGIAALARAWYGRKRQDLTLTMRNCYPAYLPGMYVSETIAGGYSEPVNGIITQVIHRFVGNTTTSIQTGYQELDFAAFG